MRILVMLALSMLTGLTAYAQEHKQRNWNSSVAFFVGAQVADTISSRGSMELNPVLGRGQFGGRQIVIKAGIAGAVILAERIMVRKHPDTQRVWMWANYAAGTAVAATAVRNWNQPPLR